MEGVLGPKLLGMYFSFVLHIWKKPEVVAQRWRNKFYPWRLFAFAPGASTFLPSDARFKTGLMFLKCAVADGSSISSPSTRKTSNGTVHIVLR